MEQRLVDIFQEVQNRIICHRRQAGKQVVVQESDKPSLGDLSPYSSSPVDSRGPLSRVVFSTRACSGAMIIFNMLLLHPCRCWFYPSVCYKAGPTQNGEHTALLREFWVAV